MHHTWAWAYRLTSVGVAHTALGCQGATQRWAAGAARLWGGGVGQPGVAPFVGAAPSQERAALAPAERVHLVQSSGRLDLRDRRGICTSGPGPAAACADRSRPHRWHRQQRHPYAPFPSHMYTLRPQRP